MSLKELRYLWEKCMVLHIAVDGNDFDQSCGKVVLGFILCNMWI